MGPSRKKPIDATQPGTLRREIIAALSIKMALLFGLWLLLFRTGGDHPHAPHDIEARLLTATSPDSQVRIRAVTKTNPITVRPLTEEVPHVQ